MLVWGSPFLLSGLGFRVQAVGLRKLEVQGLGLTVLDLGRPPQTLSPNPHVSGLGFRIYGSSLGFLCLEDFVILLS